MNVMLILKDPSSKRNGALELFAGYDNMFVNQCKNDQYARIMLFKMMEGNNYFHDDPIFNLTKTHNALALATRNTFGGQMKKISFIENLRQPNANEQQA